MIVAARECLDTPWVHQGRVPGKALDCVGLVRHAGVATGLIDGDFRHYSLNGLEGEMEYWLDHFFVRQTAPAPGDVLWLMYEGDPFPHHVALFTGPTLIQAVRYGPNRVVEHGFRSPWPSRVMGSWSYPGVDDG